jgi:hypothetical protein
MEKRRTIEHLAPWLGLLGAAFGWGLTHQVGSDSAFDDCRTASASFIVVLCLIGLLITGVGGLFSWDIWRRREETEGRRFLGMLGALLAALAAFAILLQAISALILPRCVA